MAAENNCGISQLPRDIICHILSFLPIDDIVRTSTLSRSWTRTWTLVPTSHFQDPSLGRPRYPGSIRERRLQFLDFVISRVLQQTEHTSPTTIRRLRLSTVISDDVLSEKFESLLELAARRGIELDLDLEMALHPNVFRQGPEKVYDARSLTSLRLSRCFILPSRTVERTVDWPSLGVLYLSTVLLDGRFLRSLALGCPLLETITLIRCILDGDVLYLTCLKRLLEMKVCEIFRIKKVSIVDFPSLRVVHCKGFPDGDGRIEVEIDPVTAGGNLKVLKLKFCSNANELCPTLGLLFPALKLLVLKHSGQEKITISSESLESLRVSEPGCDVLISTPGLNSLEYACARVIPKFQVDNSCLKKVDLSRLFVESCAANCFQKVKGEIDQFKHVELLTFCVSSRLIHFTPQSVAGMLKRSASPKIKHLRMKVCMTKATEQDRNMVGWYCSQLVEGLFWMCRPQFLSLVLGMGDNNEFVRVLCRKISRHMEDCRHFHCDQCFGVACWRCELRYAAIECLGENNGERNVVEYCRDLLRSNTVSGERITFTLGW